MMSSGMILSFLGKDIFKKEKMKKLKIWYVEYFSLLAGCIHEFEC